MSSQDQFRFLSERRSASSLADPVPDRSTVERILQVAGTVPDHGGLKPYRFIVIQDGGREKFAQAMVNAASEIKGMIEDKMRAKITAKAYAAPLQIVIVFSPVDNGKIPAWEQMAAAACTGYAIDLAANALGYGAVWKSFAFEPGSTMKELFQLQTGEQILGWVNIGSEENKERGSKPRPPLDLQKHALFIS